MEARVIYASQLLGRAQRVRTRVRGFAPWSSRGATLQLLDQVRGVLDEYEDYLSIAVQHGADVEAIRQALCRDSQGNASGPLAAALDILAKED
jgi:hypothetical protein